MCTKHKKDYRGKASFGRECSFVMYVINNNNHAFNKVPEHLSLQIISALELSLC